MRVWATLTGLALVAIYFIGLGLHRQAPEIVPMLVAAIAGFEMMLFAQELWLKRGMRRG
jgi:hypothetical protein